MRALREQDFDVMAGRVVDRFLQKGTKLADGAVEEAMQGQLNPDQIERLVQASNTLAFLRLMDARKAEGAPDLTHEFEPVDTRSVLQSIIGAGPTLGGEQPATPEPIDHDASPLPDEMSALRKQPISESGAIQDRNGPFANPKGEPQKASKPPAQTTGKNTRKEAMIRNQRLTKLASVFDDQLVEAELDFDDGYGRLVRSFKLAHGAPSFDAFEKDAMSVENDDHALAVLNLLRRDRGLPMHAQGTLEKCADLHDRHVADDTPSLREFRKLVKIARQATRVRNGVAHVRSLCS
jgi:hypothetical protein